MSKRLTDAAIREASARAEPIAEQIRTQDNAITAHPYFAVYEGNPNSHPKWWRFNSAFLTRAGALRFIEENGHNLDRPFVYVESAHRNMEIRAARQVFEDFPRVAAEALARGTEVEGLRAEVARLTAERDEAHENLTRLADYALCGTGGFEDVGHPPESHAPPTGIVPRTAYDAIGKWRAEVARLTRERDEAGEALWQDETRLLAALNAVRERLRQSEWILESRGPYEWDDDRYKDEAGSCFRDVDAIIAPVAKATANRMVVGEKRLDGIGKPLRDALARAEAAEAEVESLRAAAIPEDAAERAAQWLYEKQMGKPGTPGHIAWSELVAHAEASGDAGITLKLVRDFRAQGSDLAAALRSAT